MKPIALGLLLAASGALAAEAPEIVPGRVIVKLKSGTYGPAAAAQTPAAALDAISKKAGARSSTPLFESRMGPASADARSLAEKFPARARRADPGVAAPDLSQIYVLEVDPGADLAALIRELRKDPSVAYVHPDFVFKPNAAFNDPYLTSSGTWVKSAYGPRYDDPMDNYDDLWHLRTIQADKAWDHAQGQGAVIAIVDTGVDYNHPDLAANLWTNPADGSHGWALDTNNSDFMDTYGHGTHVAGIAAAVGNNGKGIVGVAPRAKIMGIRLDAGARWNTTIMARGFRWAVDHGADIINHSGGGPVSKFADWEFGEPGVLIDALNYAAANGVAVVASAGNWGISIQNSDYLPAAYPGVIGVGATDANDHLTSWSNYGPGVLLSAPGGNECWAACVAGANPGEFRMPESIDRHNILSARASGARYPDEITKVTDEYMRVGGTSMSAPVVSGAVALMLSANANLTLAQIRSTLTQSADPIPYPGAGAGRLNAYRAVLRAKGLSDAPGQLPRPVISGLNASADANSLTVSFATDQDAIGVIYIGSTTGNYHTAVADALPTKNHTLTIRGLKTGFTYHYMPVARTRHTAARGADATAETVAGPAPVITAVSASGVTGTEATITWTTDIDADGAVDFGPTASYGSRVAEPAGLRKTHSVRLTGLTPSKLYHYSVSSKGTGQTARSADATFTTGVSNCTISFTAPVEGAVLTSSLDAPTLTLKATADCPSPQLVEVSLNGFPLEQDFDLAAPGEWQSQYYQWRNKNFLGLAGGQYTLTAAVAVGAARVSTQRRFEVRPTINPDPAYGATVSNVAVTAIGEREATVTWTTDRPDPGWVRFGQTRVLERVVFDAEPATSHSATLTGLRPGTRHFVAVNGLGVVSFLTAGAEPAEPSIVLIEPLDWEPRREDWKQVHIVSSITVTGGLDRVEYFDNGTLIATYRETGALQHNPSCGLFPIGGYQCYYYFDVTTPGLHLLSAKVYDKAGRSATSQEVRVYRQPAAPQAPPASAGLSAMGAQPYIWLWWSADVFTYKKLTVERSVDGVTFAHRWERTFQPSYQPFRADRYVLLRENGLPPGNYHYRLRFDNDAGSSYSNVVTISAGPPPLPVALTSPSDGASVTGTITVTAEACEGAAKVELYEGDTLLGVMSPAAN